MRNLIHPRKKVQNSLDQLKIGAIRSLRDIGSVPAPPLPCEKVPTFFLPTSGVVVNTPYREGKEMGGVLLVDALVNAIVGHYISR